MRHFGRSRGGEDQTVECAVDHIADRSGQNQRESHQYAGGCFPFAQITEIVSQQTDHRQPEEAQRQFPPVEGSARREPHAERRAVVLDETQLEPRGDDHNRLVERHVGLDPDFERLIRHEEHEEQYRDFAVRYEYFYKIVVHGELAGVLLAYESKHIEMDEKSNMLLKYALNKEFVLIKQVFVSPDFQRKGIASFLYDYLQDVIGGKKPLVAVVVLDPFNSGSSYFHQEKGFHEFLNFVPDADPDGVVRKRAAWIKPSAEAKGNIMFDLRLNNTIDGTDDLGDVMVSRMENLVQLYIHEDNLNWTKFSLQTTILFALFATFAYFYEKEILSDTFPVLVTVGIWGAIINILFILKIRSGIRYMNTYKGKIQDFDLLVSFHYPKLKKIFNRDEFIARKSITCRLLYFTSVVGLISWVVVSVLLVCKAMHWFTIF